MEETVSNVEQTISFRVDPKTFESIKSLQEQEKRRYVGEMIRVLVAEAIEARQTGCVQRKTKRRK